MVKIVLLVTLATIFTGCKKTVDNIQQDLVIMAMTDGQWKVTSFKENGSDITASFTNYRFKYYSNKTVDAIVSGTVQQTGTWNGEAATMTTSANFPGASSPLHLVNGDWKIDNNSWTHVVATQTTPNGSKTMRLEKD